MTWKSTAALTAATSLAAWLFAPAHQDPGVRPVAGRARAAQLPELPSLDVEAARLAAHREARAAASTATRNPFRFAVRQSAVPRVAAPVDAPAAPPVFRRPLRLRLAGIASDVVDGAPRRTAILTGTAGVVLAQAGEQVDGFTVTAIGDQDVTLTSLDDGRTERLSLDR